MNTSPTPKTNVDQTVSFHSIIEMIDEYENSRFDPAPTDEDKKNYVTMVFDSINNWKQSKKYNESMIDDIHYKIWESTYFYKAFEIFEKIIYHNNHIWNKYKPIISSIEYFDDVESRHMYLKDRCQRAKREFDNTVSTLEEFEKKMNDELEREKKQEEWNSIKSEKEKLIQQLAVLEEKEKNILNN